MAETINHKESMNKSIVDKVAKESNSTDNK